MQKENVQASTNPCSSVARESPTTQGEQPCNDELPVTLKVVPETLSASTGQQQVRKEAGNFQGNQSEELPTEKIADIRQQLTAYAASLLASEADAFRDFGNEVTITEIASYYIYHIAFETTCEKRELVRKEKPYDGSPPSEPTVTENGLNVWSYSLQSGNKQLTEYSVLGSEKAVACSQCGASGQVPCRKCEGSGYVQCPKCNGTQRLRCSTCEGAGSLEKEEWAGQRQVRCKEWSCRGGIADRGMPSEHRCYICAGSGFVPKDVYRTVCYSCNACDGKGAFLCPACYTNGNVDCETCKKKGNVACSGCNGRGYKGIRYLAINQSFSAATKSGYSSDGELPHETVARLLTPTDYDEVLNVSEQEFSPAVSITLKVPDSAKAWIHNAITDSRRSTASDSRIVKQQLRVCCVAATVCQYTHHGKKYSFGSLGKRKVPFAEKSPMQEYLFGQMELGMLQGSLLKCTFDVWAKYTWGGLPGVLVGLSLLYLFIWAPLRRTALLPVSAR